MIDPMVRAATALAALLAACNGDNQYVGYVAVDDTWVYAAIETTSCRCPDDPPRVGECASWTDDIPVCDCDVCNGTHTLRLPGGTQAWQSDPPTSIVGLRQPHSAAPGEAITYEFDGCNGSFTATLTVPEPIAIAIDAPESLGDETRVRWSPSGGDVASVGVYETFSGVTCRGPDSGEALIPRRLYFDSSVRVQSFRETGAVHEANAELALFQATTAVLEPLLVGELGLEGDW